VGPRAGLDVTEKRIGYYNRILVPVRHPSFLLPTMQLEPLVLRFLPRNSLRSTQGPETENTTFISIYTCFMMYKLVFNLVSVRGWRKFIIELIFTQSTAVVKDVRPNSAC
jgi:hypothetical protein